MIYLDWAATSQTQFFVPEAPWGNANAPYSVGVEAAVEMEKAEQAVKDAIGATNGHVVWTMSGSHANSIALEWACGRFHQAIALSATSHKSVWQYSTPSMDHFYVNVYGYPNIYSEHLKKTKFISVDMVNNETGAEWPYRRLRNEGFNGILHVDAVQALGRTPFSVNDGLIDMVTLSAHKVGGPKGLGCLWVSGDIDFNIPYLGTPNVPGMMQFRKAIEWNCSNILQNMKQLSRLEAVLMTTLRHECGEFTTHCPHLWVPRGTNLQEEDPWAKAPGILSINTGTDAAGVVLRCDPDVIINTGAACLQQQKSRVLYEMGIASWGADKTIRVSFSKDQKIEEVEEGARIIARAIKETIEWIRTSKK